MGWRQPRVLIRLLALVLATAAVVAVVVVARETEPRRATLPSRAAPTVPRIGAPHEPERPHPPRSDPDERAALSAARRFLAGYLPYSYGQAPAARVRAAAPPLRAQLHSSPPRVPAEARRLLPRLVDLEVVSSSGDLGIDISARVDDGRRRYSMVLGMRPSGGRWLVTALS
jgi:hypothetical protein